MIPVNVDFHAFFLTWYFIIFFYHHRSLKFGYIKCTVDVAFVGSFLDIVFDQYVRGGRAKKLPSKTQNWFIVASFCLTGVDCLVRGSEKMVDGSDMGPLNQQ